MAAPAPDFQLTTRLVARSLGTTPEGLRASLRPVTTEELPRVFAFRRAHLGARVHWDDQRYLPWRYDLGEPGRGFGELWALWRGDEPLGLVGAERMTLQRGERRIEAQRLQDLLILPELGDSGLAVWLNQAMFARAPLTIAVGANELSVGVVRRLFTPIAPMQQAVRPIHWSQVAAGSRSTSRWIRPVAPLAGLAATAWHWAQRALLEPGIEVLPIEAFGAGEQILSATPAGNGHTVIALRTARYLDRRVFHNPRVVMKGVALRRRGQPLGHLVWRLARDAQGRRDLRLVDWGLAGDAPAGAWSTLWCAAVDEAARSGCAAVRLAAQHPSTLPRLRRHGFIAREVSDRQLVGVHAEPGVNSAQWVHGDWCLTELSDDGDEA